MNILETLKTFQDHAGVNYEQTQNQAHRAWRVLKDLLTDEELGHLSTAWSHATAWANASREELDHVCAEIRAARGLTIA